MKTVVISGGTSGIGKRLVELFLNEKMKVFTFSSKKKNVISFTKEFEEFKDNLYCYQCNIGCLLYTSPSPRDRTRSRMPSSA